MGNGIVRVATVDDLIRMARERHLPWAVREEADPHPWGDGL